MMKRFLICFVFTVLFSLGIGVTTAQAMVIPLEDSGAEVMLKNEKSVSLQYCRIEIRPVSGSAVYSADVVLRNDGSDREILVGMPKYFYAALADVNSLSVTCNSSSVKVTQRDMVKNPDAENNPNYSSCYCWTVNAKSGEEVCMTLSFTVSTRAYVNGSQVIDVPLSAFDYWSGVTGNIDVKLDSLSLSVYSYDKTPSVMPSEVYDNGMLEWHISSKAKSNNFSVYYSLDYNVLQKFYSNVYTTGAEKAAADLFKAKKYSDAILLIDSSLSGSDDFIYMKSLCLEKLGRSEEALALLEGLLGKDVCFSTNSEFDLSEYAKKRMLYQYYSANKNKTEKNEVVKQMLSDGIKTLSESKSSVFIEWAKNELNSKGTVAEEKKQEEDEPIQQGFSFKKWLSGMSEPLMLTVCVVMLGVVAFCVMGLLSTSKPKKKIKNHSMKR